MDGEEITFDDCVENCSIAEGFLKPNSLPDKAKEKKDFQEICLACKYHDLD
jgi:hypothetical protein